MKKLILSCVTFFAISLHAQNPNIEIAKTILKIWPDTVPIGGTTKWSYDMGVILKGFEGMWLNSGDVQYYNAIQKKMDYFVQPNGIIKGYEKTEYNIDHINNGKLVLMLYRITGNKKYKIAADSLRSQLSTHPRTKEGGFWHKKIYTNQMWLDGLYMGAPFYAEYAMLFHDEAAFDDIANQFIWMEQHARESKTGLLYHGWDESKEQQWANKVTGCSPHFWSRAMGWYSDALVDVLDYFPKTHPRRKEIIGILNRLVNAIEKQQDAKTGLWYDVMNYSGEGKEKNYFEASASSQFVYAVAKGVRKGYLPYSKLKIATKGWDGLVKNFIKVDSLGYTNLHGTVKVSGLGGKPYRDGSFAYYMSEPVIANDPKGLGAFLLASNEIEILKTIKSGQGKKVVLDRYFNSEKRKDITGVNNYWHYTWEERSHPGFNTFGYVFEKNGATIASLDQAPTAANLKNANVYIVVDADHVKDNPSPNTITSKDVDAIKLWVKNGGRLLLMANDSANCDLVGSNLIANQFGIQFSNKSINMVKDNKFEQGAVYVDNNKVFRKNKLYIKELSPTAATGTGKVQYIVTNNGDNIMTIANYGKGKVFAIGDPWLYNEYVDGRKLPNEFNNYKAAEDLVKWLLRK